MKIEFQKQFGKGTDPWYAKAERWVKKNESSEDRISTSFNICLEE